MSMKAHRALIAAAENAILSSYCAACSEEKRAINPVELTDSPEIQEYLEEAYAAAIQREKIVESGTANDGDDPDDHR